MKNNKLLFILFFILFFFCNINEVFAQGNQGFNLYSNTVADISEKAAPSVVSLEVSIKGKAKVPSITNIFDLMGAKILEVKLKELSREARVADGSGFIVSSDGYIVTNYHVINPPSPYGKNQIVKASKIEVILYDGQKYVAKVVGEDKDSDLAVIKIEAVNLQPIQWGDSSRVRPGDFGITIGSSLGADHTVGFGVISAVSRKKPEIGLLEAQVGNLDYIQTYAQINPGNSGGPLINLQGEVIGIANFIERAPHSPGFAIPSNYAREIANILIKEGKVRRPSIGAHLYPFKESNSPFLQRRSSKNKLQNRILGVMILDVFEEGPVDKLDLRPEDLITEFEDQSVDSIEKFLEMIYLIRSKPVGTKFKLNILRDNERFEVFVKSEYLD
ncbi:MAG: trypsin-like peptidase domain-containing protein [Candidatus Caenarcaniphilales bacterium]|nr:trypsin-like peptidase domain-containing protein [Candidatus Caenarcaniphilales bacterium]